MAISIWPKENQKTKSTPVAYHPGALKYFKEKKLNLN